MLRDGRIKGFIYDEQHQIFKPEQRFRYQDQNNICRNPISNLIYKEKRTESKNKTLYLDLVYINII